MARERPGLGLEKEVDVEGWGGRIVLPRVSVMLGGTGDTMDMLRASPLC